MEEGRELLSGMGKRRVKNIADAIFFVPNVSTGAKTSPDVNEKSSSRGSGMVGKCEIIADAIFFAPGIWAARRP